MLELFANLRQRRSFVIPSHSADHLRGKDLVMPLIEAGRYNTASHLKSNRPSPLYLSYCNTAFHRRSGSMDTSAATRIFVREICTALEEEPVYQMILLRSKTKVHFLFEVVDFLWAQE